MAIALRFSKSEASLPWGFRLVGGVDFEQPIVVVKVNPDSLAESSGLQVGDIIVRVENTSTASLTHNEVHDLLLSAGLEFELGIRRGEIPTRIFCDEDFDIEECNSIKQAIEEEVLNEAITRINNMKNKIVSSTKTPSNIISENLLGQEEIVNTTTLQTTLDVKKGRKWSTFLIKPETTPPKPKKKEDEPAKVEPYRVFIKKQTRRPLQEKKVQFDQNVTELEVDFENYETEESHNADEAIQSESAEVDIDVVVNEETYIVDEDTKDYDTEIETDIEQDESEAQVYVEETEDALENEESLGIPSSLEEQLIEVQKQLKALSQLPSAIQLTLDAVSKQLASIVGEKESAERNAEQGEYTSSSKDEEGDEPQTEEEYLEETSTSEKAEAELLREGSDANSIIGDDLEEDAEKYDANEGRIVENDDREEESFGLSPEEEEALRKQEELEAKKEKNMEERTPKPNVRPIILPGGRKWSMPEDAIPSFRKPKMSEEKIIETIENNLEVIIGNRKGETNCWKVPSKAVATKSINFLKYQPPPKNLDYLQRSEVYRLVHDMEPPVRGITTRAEKVLAEQDYYEATKGAP